MRMEWSAGHSYSDRVEHLYNIHISYRFQMYSVLYFTVLYYWTAPLGVTSLLVIKFPLFSYPVYAYVPLYC